jgi:acyl carrier protein
LIKEDIACDIKQLMIDEFEMDTIEEIPEDAKMGSIRQWDSLAHVNLLVALQDKYSIEFSPEEIAETLSLASLIKTIYRKLGIDSGEQTAVFGFVSGVWEKLFFDLWQEDELHKDDVIYIHSRVQSVLEVFKGNIADAVDYLRFGGGGNRTLIFPAFPFSSRTYTDYIKARARFSVTATPAATGLLPEMMLKEPSVRRSAHPILSECAVGPQAGWITKDAHLDKHPFHSASTYIRMQKADAAMIGLGVDINTNAIIHMVDDKLKTQYHYPFDLYIPEPLEFEIELADHSIIRRSYLAYSPDMVKRIKPRNIRPYFADYTNIYKEIETNGVWFYRIRIKPFLARCEEIARQCLSEGKLPPWFLE